MPNGEVFFRAALDWKVHGRPMAWPERADRESPAERDRDLLCPGARRPPHRRDPRMRLSAGRAREAPVDGEFVAGRLNFSRPRPARAPQPPSRFEPLYPRCRTPRAAPAGPHYHAGTVRRLRRLVRHRRASRQALARRPADRFTRTVEFGRRVRQHRDGRNPRRRHRCWDARGKRSARTGSAFSRARRGPPTPADARPGMD